MDDQAVEQSVEDRMANFLMEEEGETPQDDEETTQAAEQEEEEDSEEEQSDEPQTIRLKRGDEEVEIDLEEAKNLAQMGFDYTKKTQEVAEQRRQVEQYAQAVQAQEQQFRQQVEMQQAFIQDLAKAESLNSQVQQYEQLDWNMLSDQDPVQAQKLWFQYQNLQGQRTQAYAEIKEKQNQMQQQQEQQYQAHLQQAMVKLKEEIPDWSDNKRLEIRDAGKSYGFNDQELSSVIDPRMVKVLADAAAWRKLQAEKGNVTNKVSSKPPVIKPGAKDTKRAARADFAKERSALKKSGDSNLAAKLIERML